MSLIYKLIILLTEGSIFSLKYLRNIRWWAYNNFFRTSNLRVADHVKIVKAHLSGKELFAAGTNVNIGEYSYIDYSGGVVLGNHLAISQGVKIFTHNHNVHGEHKDWNKNPISFSKLIIEDYSWIGSNVVVVESVSLIAEGSIIAAGSILTKNTEPYSIYAGNPAKKIASRLVHENKI